MASERIGDIVSAYQSAAMERDDYWRAMQQRHLELREYCGLVERARLQLVEIDGFELRVVLENGLRIRWKPEDVRTAPNILINHGEYESGELSVLEHLAQSCSVILDVGANIGWYSLHLARLLKRTGGAIYAFEPVPRTFAELTHNIELNGYGDVIHAFNHGLGDTAGSVRFYVPSFTGSVAASQQVLFPDDQNEEVECLIVPLDAFVHEQGIDHVDLIKCDVEGSELLVLRGGMASIERHKPVIMLEMLRKWSRRFGYHPNDIIALLGGSGYQCWSFRDGGFTEVSSVDDACTETNFFFLHADRHKPLLAEMAHARHTPRSASES